MPNSFTPFHINATSDDFVGNDGIGPYVFLPGSDGRAKEIAAHFDNHSVKSHPRGHHLHLGTLNYHGKTIQVAAIASGMGCPSMEIILHELFHLGAKRFLRVGTAGSLQEKFVSVGDIVNATASVRDELTTSDYVPREVPAISSIEISSSVLQAANKLNLPVGVHTDIVHCKSSFYAREFGAGPLSAENTRYIQLLTDYGVLATEMETAALFIQSQLYNHQLQQQGNGAQHRVLAGAVLGILAVPPQKLASAEQASTLTKNLVELAIETMKTLAVTEL